MILIYQKVWGIWIYYHYFSQYCHELAHPVEGLPPPLPLEPEVDHHQVPAGGGEAGQTKHKIAQGTGQPQFPNYVMENISIPTEKVLCLSLTLTSPATCLAPRGRRSGYLPPLRRWNTFSNVSDELGVPYRELK